MLFLWLCWLEAVLSLRVRVSYLFRTSARSGVGPGQGQYLVRGSAEPVLVLVRVCVGCGLVMVWEQVSFLS